MYRVLLVDDWEIFLLELRRMNLWGNVSGFETTASAENGKQALELLRKEHYDLVLTDIRMPVMDGLQLLRSIQKERLCPCVVLLSEYSEFRYARQGIVLGAFDYLVKPAEESALLELFGRAREFLDSRALKRFSAETDIDAGIGKYPTEEENRILDGFQNRDSKTLILFRHTVKDLYGMLGDDLIRADILVRRLYYNVVEAVYCQFPWLHSYRNIRSFDAADSLRETAEVSHDFYFQSIRSLLAFIQKCLPGTQTGTVAEICGYILSHPEEDLKLKILAQKFYINPTYLSSTFITKTGIHFNDYVTQIKMERAKYLFLNTELKIYDISYQLGYRDINYFSRKFKMHCGMSPTAYRGQDGAKPAKATVAGE